MNATIERFIPEQRARERSEQPPFPPCAPYPAFNPRKVQIIRSRFPEGAHIDVFLHHSSEFSDGDFFHCHDFFEMIYIYRGHAIQRFPGRELTLREHDLLLLNPNTVHAPLTTDPADCMFNIIISRELFRETLRTSEGEQELLSNFVFDCLYQLSQARDYLFFPADPSGQTAQLAECLISEFIRGEMNFERAVEAWLTLLLTQLTRTYREEGGQVLLADRETNRVVADILDYMNRNAATTSLEELAGRFGYSVGHISRLIRQHTGRTYAEIIQHAKLERARQILQSTDEPVSAVMDRAGFHSPQHFYRIFRQRYLMSPTEYRRNCRDARHDGQQDFHLT